MEISHEKIERYENTVGHTQLSWHHCGTANASDRDSKQRMRKWNQKKKWNTRHLDQNANLKYYKFINYSVIWSEYSYEWLRFLEYHESK